MMPRELQSHEPAHGGTLLLCGELPMRHGHDGVVGLYPRPGICTVNKQCLHSTIMMLLLMNLPAEPAAGRLPLLGFLTTRRLLAQHIALGVVQLALDIMIALP